MKKHLKNLYQYQSRNPLLVELQDFSSSNINEVIKAVLNFLLFFYEKILHAPKSTKSTKWTQGTKGTKSTKKHQKHKNTTKQKQKTQISKQKLKMRLKTCKGKKVAYLRFCACKEKDKKVSTMEMLIPLN